jgi:hypothetical protein
MTPTPITAVLDGQTLTPGVYSEASSTFSLAGTGAGTLILNGAGVYIFQASSTLVTGAGGVPTITLENGATAANVYWLVGSSATINSGHGNSSNPFQGNVIAHTSITVTTGGAVNGSLVALNGAVTLSAGQALAAEALTPSFVAGPSNPAPGYAWVQLKSNYNRYLGGFSGFVSPTTGSTQAIDSTALTIGNPYIVASVGVGPKGAATIAPVADSSGSLASTYFMLYDSYGNAFCIYCIVNGVGGAPNLGPGLSPAQLASGVRGLSYQPLVLATNASADAITTALSTMITAFPSGINGVYSFTASGGGTGTLTVTSTLNAPLAGVPQDGSIMIPTGNGQPFVPQSVYFTISTGSASAGSVWTDQSGNLYTVATSLSSGTTLKTTGSAAPSPAAGTLTYVSGSGATTTLNYSAASAGLATGFTFALTVNTTNLQEWQAIGLQPGLTPTVGQSFIAKATGSGGGSTGRTISPGVSGVQSIEVIGDPNQSFAPMPQGGSPHVGGWILVQCLASGGVTAPADGSTCGMSFYVDARLSPSNIGL